MSNYPTTNPTNLYATPLDAYSNPSVLPTTSGLSQPPRIATTAPMTGTGTLASPAAHSTGPTVYSSANTVPPMTATSDMGAPLRKGMGQTVPVSTTNNKVVDNLPSNQQIERTLERVREQVNIAKHETEGLNSTGEKILVDTERLVDSATQFLREKNEGGKVQRLAQEGLLARRDISAQAREARDSWDVVEGFDSDRLRSLARETLQTARMAGMELVRSRKFRAQIRSLINLFSEAISADIADSSDSDYDTTVNTLKRPSAQQLRAVPSSYERSPEGGEVEIPVDGAGVGGLSDKLQRGLSLGRGRKLRLNQEQTDQLAERFTELLRDISRRPSTAQLLRKVLDVFRLFDEEIDSEQRGQVTGGLRSMADSEHLRRTLALAQEIFETFTGTKTLDPLIAHWRAIAVSFSKDEETRSYFHSLRRFFAGILDHPERLSEHETMNQMKQHIRWAQQLHDEKLYEHLSGTLYEAKAILRQVERDPATLRLKNDAKALLGDIMLDEQGNIVLNTEALEQLRLIIIQSLIERVRIPVPSISIDNPDMQLRLSNIVVTLRDLIPESVVMSNSGRMALNLTNLKEGIDTSTHGQELIFEIKNVNIYIEDADIWFRRNKFPKVEDEGKIRISIGGSGVDLKLIVRTFIRSKNILQVDRVICDVHNMKLHLYETRHNFLYNAMVKILSGKIKHNVERSVEHNIADYMERLNRVLTKQIAVARSKGSHLGPIAGLKNRITHGDTRVMAGETRHTAV